MHALLQMELPQVVAFVEYGFVDDVVPPHVAALLRCITPADMQTLKGLASRGQLQQFLMAHVSLKTAQVSHVGVPAILHMLLTGKDPNPSPTTE